MAPAFVPTVSLRTNAFIPSPNATSSLRRPSFQRSTLLRTRRTPLMVQKSTAPPTSATSLTSFASFFACMPGAWNSQRTYHYLSPGSPQSREESQTTFDVERLSSTQVSAVLLANSAVPGDTSSAEGFRVSFLTKMESQEELVRAGTNLAFVPESVVDGRVEGAYYRDVGYEERGPVTSRFVFDEGNAQLQMTTWYSKVVSVDEIRLVNDELRLRRIINYRRPEKEDMPLDDAMLIGYGVEVKGERERLVV